MAGTGGCPRDAGGETPRWSEPRRLGEEEAEVWGGAREAGMGADSNPQDVPPCRLSPTYIPFAQASPVSLGIGTKSPGTPILKGTLTLQGRTDALFVLRIRPLPLPGRAGEGPGLPLADLVKLNPRGSALAGVVAVRGPFLTAGLHVFVLAAGHPSP